MTYQNYYVLQCVGFSPNCYVVVTVAVAIEVATVVAARVKTNMASAAADAVTDDRCFDEFCHH
jgi:hypothetical protein